MSIHKPQTDTAFSCCSLCSFRHLDYSPPWSWAWVVFSHILYIYLKKEKKKKGKKASGSQNIAFQVPQDILSNAKAWWYGPIINPLQQPLKTKKQKNIMPAGTISTFLLDVPNLSSRYFLPHVHTYSPHLNPVFLPFPSGHWKQQWQFNNSPYGIGDSACTNGMKMATSVK